MSRCPKKLNKIPNYDTETELELSDENSPININTHETIPVNMGVLQTETLWSETASILENDGIRGVSISLSRPGLILHGPLGENYRFKELHFHWGFSDDDGTEHSLDDNFGTIEAHFVFIRAYTIHTDIEYLETAKEFDEKVAHRGPVQLKKRNEAKSESAVRMQIMENKVEEIEEKMILDRWQKEKARKAVQHRRPTKFEFDTLPTYKEREQSIDIGYKDEEEVRRQVMTQEDFTKFKDMLKMQQSARKCAERQAHLDSKEKYVKWKAKEEAYDEKIKKQREEEDEKLNQEEILLSTQSSTNDMAERKRRKAKTADLFRERVRKDTANKQFDEKLRIKRTNELNEIQTKTIELVCNIAVLFEIDDNAPFYEAFSYFSQVQEPFTEASVDKNLLTEFKDCLSSPNYYAYHSHQSPSESQGLLWIIMRDTLPIRKSQVDNFRHMKSMYGVDMLASRRAVKDMKRKVYMNWKPAIPKEFVCPGKEYCHCDGGPDPKRPYWEI